ncbi:hypothetical protein OPV22_030704 [Ensete ventricosum]|uniref:Uncharacterized protein n=1 Tax=Ensete ventricosum TaxID=4639 RepID=A0AAV8P6B2_ENSVE|nr:hypothetical protein OPV22_030699 [Ensete ventricosum]KAJ8468152.1 hypothetical protein OPV22_030704 [Ensete ventricosum]
MCPPPVHVHGQGTLARWLAACSYSTRMHARCASGRPQSERPRHERRLQAQARSSICADSVLEGACDLRRERCCQQALRVAVPSPSADLQNSGASTSAAGSIASGRPVTKCRFAEFRREHFCSRQHCEWPSRHQVQICTIQARALLQQALRVAVPSPSALAMHMNGRKFRQARALLQQALRVAVPSPSADLQNSGGALLQQAALRVAVPSPSADLQNSGGALLQQAALRVAVPSPSADLQNSGASAAAAGTLRVAVPSPSADLQISATPRALLQRAALRVAVPSPSADFSHATSAAAAAV